MMIATRALAAAVAIAATVAMTTAAHAQSPEAEVLFREAKKLMKQEAFAAACDKFEASERLEASIGTELNLADCREKTGQLASAWAAFIKAAQTAKHNGDKKRQIEARRRAAALEPKLAYLTIAVAKPARVDGLVVHRNDAVVDAAAYDQPLPVDPGDYQITAEAPGHERWQHAISIGRASKTVEVPQLGVVVAPEPPPPPRVVEAVPTAPARPSLWTTRRKAAVALGALGIAAGATGIAFGLHANDLERQSDAICQSVRCNSPEAIDLNRRARNNGLVANLGMIGGGALVVGAIALWWLGDPKRHDGIAIAPILGPSGIALGGTY